MTTFTTRAEAAAPPAHLVETMARAHYEAGRWEGALRPRWEQLIPEWHESARAEMSAAIRAAEVAGLIEVRR